MLGMLSSMLASQAWQLAATYLAWPVSGTHTIISALMGFTMVEKGAQVSVSIIIISISIKLMRLLNVNTADI